MTITKDERIQSAQIEGDKFKGRITIVTNENTQINTLARADANDENGGYDTDQVMPFFQQRVGIPIIQLMPAGEDSTGWEIFTTDLLQPNTTYVWNYHVETITQ